MRGFRAQGGYMATTYNWTLYIVTAGGIESPHWTDTSRERCREVRRGMGALPRGVTTRIKKGA